MLLSELIEYSDAIREYKQYQQYSSLRVMAAIKLAGLFVKHKHQVDSSDVPFNDLRTFERRSDGIGHIADDEMSAAEVLLGPSAVEIANAIVRVAFPPPTDTERPPALNDAQNAIELAATPDF